MRPQGLESLQVRLTWLLPFSAQKESDISNMRLVTVRHGETLANINKIVQGQLPGELSPHGRLQARLLAQRLSEEKVSHIWSSTLTRARETAEEIVRFHKIKVETLPELKERCFGILEGKSFDDYFQALEKSGQPFFRFSPPGGESLQELEGRVGPLMEKLQALPPSATILVIAHGIINKIILKVLLDKTFDDWQKIRQDNTCVNILETNRQSGKFESLLLNCTNHLNREADPASRNTQPASGISYENLSGLSSLPGPPDH